MNAIAIRAKFPSATTAGQLVIEGDFPALSGSEKQVTWAGEIRSRKQAEFAAAIARMAGATWGVILEKDTDFIAETHAKMDAFLADKPQAVAALRKLFSITDARFWIDNREDGINQMLKSASTF